MLLIERPFSPLPVNGFPNSTPDSFKGITRAKKLRVWDNLVYNWWPKGKHHILNSDLNAIQPIKLCHCSMCLPVCISVSPQ